MSAHQALGGRIFTKPFLVLLLIFVVGLVFMVERFSSGMGAVSNLNGGFAWGIWVVFDVVVGTAFACGGYALAFMVYVFNKGQYHPLVRPAVLASLLGYALGGFGAFFDMGRFWQFYEIFIPGNWNFNSVMLEVGLCVAVYIIILALEFAPAVLEKFGMHGLLKSLNKVLFFLIALGVLLPTMHQSSLGSLLIAMGHKVHPLWQVDHMQPVLALISALIMGFSIVIFEASTSAVGFSRKSEASLLAKMRQVIIGLLSTFLIVRLLVLLVQGKLGLIFAADFASLMILLETALFAIPLVILLSPERSSRGSQLLIAAMCMLMAGSLYRFDAFLLTFNPGPGYSYFPSAAEIMITLGVVAFEIMAYLILVKTLPVLHREERAL
ncbi:MAG: Ni/Fe-hydrogenase cytochrome b subunit [Gammaproteobacteria bacterium]|nr:Ni/Fe-hydrogenase cytochrome b subunit [Gammaproteobacteria bacterium]MBL6998846.1 Ni/Fe-hydrogenase cytochrome b subunit [Gammaproteobacteria bacterium]